MGQERTITVSKPTPTELKETTSTNQPTIEGAAAALHGEDCTQDTKALGKQLSSSYSAEHPSIDLSSIPPPPLHGKKGKSFYLAENAMSCLLFSLL